MEAEHRLKAMLRTAQGVREELDLGKSCGTGKVTNLGSSVSAQIRQQTHWPCVMSWWMCHNYS